MIGLRQFRRLIQILWILGSHLAADRIQRWLQPWPGLRRRFPALSLESPERLRRAFEALGGTFVKLGQMLALQPDILSFAYCNALYDLLDSIPPFETEAVERIFQEELGRLPTEVFDRFDPHPIASASIGQVHLAYLNHQKLAVKVQRPEAETYFNADIQLMKGWIWCIQTLKWTRLYWMIEPLSEFMEWTREELDYRREARYMACLGANAKDNPQERIPTVLWEVTTRRILTAEYLDGPTVLQYLRTLDTNDARMSARLAGNGFDPSTFAQHVIENFVSDAFTHGFYHADLHPGNLLLLEENTVGYVDFGITGVLSHHARQRLIEMTLAYVQGNLDGMHAAFLELSTLSEASDPAAFRQGLDKYAEEWYDMQGQVRSLRKNFTLMMFDMLKLSRKTGIFPERDVVKYIRSAIASDGLISRFAPPFNVGEYLAHVCEHLLQTQARASLLSQDVWISWLNLSGFLLQDDTWQTFDKLYRMASGTLPVRVHLQQPTRRAGQPLDMIELALIVLIVAILMPFTEPHTWGWNLFTAQGVFITGAILILTYRVVRL